ncbi:MAG: tetratricopeptide repeat protein [Magnetococcales bacterium]|nr:tetratricopeptide repeat protein [Magnetococcales bacterium]
MSPDPDFTAQAQAFHAQGRLQEALEAAARGLALDGGNPTLLNLAAVCSAGLGLLDQAEACWRQALERQPDNLECRFNLAVLLTLRQRPAEAEAACRAVLARQPDHAEALDQLGTLLRNRGCIAEAETAYEAALAAHPDFANARYNLGVLLMATGRPVAAEAAFRTALASRPDLVEARCHLGHLLQEQGQFEAAEAAFREVLARQPDHAEAHFGLGLLLARQGRAAGAAAAFRAVLALRPSHPEANNNLGILLANDGRRAEAENAFRTALAGAPDSFTALLNLGLLLTGTDRLEEAEALLHRALRIQPDHAEAHNALAAVLLARDRPTAAAAVLNRALELDPGHPGSHNTLGNLRHRQGDPDGAAAAYRQALALKPDYHEAHSNLGVLWTDLHDPAAAEAAFRTALALRPDYVEARFNLGLLLLRRGRMTEGWPLHEDRYHPGRRHPTAAPPRLSCPQWRGGSLAGKTLLVLGEQGLGDEIQFCRYLKPLRDRNPDSTLIFLCKPTLAPLLRGLAGVDRLVTRLTEAPPADGWCFLMSLPLLLETRLETIPATLPYLAADPQRLSRWRPLIPTAGLRIGLVWKGAAHYANDAWRSLPGLKTLAPLWSALPRGMVTFVSLQKGAGQEEAAAPPPDQPLLDLGTALTDWADTAAIVAQLDLVICVDTALAHLCGALARPCWVLLPRNGRDWRWLDDRTDSPWYPGVLRLFGQGRNEEWGMVVERMAGALTDLGRQLPPLC